MTKRLEDMTYRELEAAKHKVEGQIRALKEEARTIASAMDKLQVLENAKQKVAQMSVAEKASLSQALQVKGIASEESVSSPEA